MRFQLVIFTTIFVLSLSVSARIFDEFEERSSFWKPGLKGFTTITNFDSVAIPPRTLLAEIYPLNPHLIRYGVPFDLPAEFDEILATRIEAEESIAVMLPEDAREIFILLSADFPEKEPFGDGGERLLKLTTIDEPERMDIEITYSDGTSDNFIPLNVRKPAYGVENGLGLYVIHPDKNKVPITMTLRDKMRNGCFGIWAVTINTRKPVVEEPVLPLVWYEMKKSKPSSITIDFNHNRGLAWGTVESAVWGGKIPLMDKPVFSFIVETPDSKEKLELKSTMWTVADVQKSENLYKAALVFRTNMVNLKAEFTAQKIKPDEVIVSLDIKNVGVKPVKGKLFFPTIQGIKFKNWEDTWYFASRLGGVINKVKVQFHDRIGELHPMQVDGFFSVEYGGGICLIPQDLTEIFRWYNIGKDDDGGNYSLEFLEETVNTGEKWKSAPVLISAVAGDWKDQFKKYISWKDLWYEKKSPRPLWFREVFSFASCYAVENLNFINELNTVYDKFGACDYAHLFGWAMTKKYGHWGDYAHFFQFGKSDEDGKKNFIELIRHIQKSGVPVGLYIDGYLVSPTSINPAGYEREQWGIRNSAGTLAKYYGDCLSMCPYVPEWRRYLCNVYKRIAQEIAPDGLYIDEFGRSLEDRICFATNHNHSIPIGMAPGEGILIKEIRESIPSNIVLYTEFTPSDVSSQFIDGAFSYLYPTAYLGNENWWLNLRNKELTHERVAPHYVNLYRFAFPDFKIFHIIYSVPHQNGNWFLLKFPFFNGEGYYLKGEAIWESDGRATAFYRKVFSLQRKFIDAFTSSDVEPLVKTEFPHLFANRFSTPDYTVWTLYNANYRTLRGTLLKVNQPKDGQYQYYDAWNNRIIQTKYSGNTVELIFDIPPRSVGCVVQQKITK